MLTQLATVKARLALLPTDLTYDNLLLTAIVSLSARFDRETNRVLSRQVNTTYEFSAEETELRVPAYPIEAVNRFELKTTETEGWTELANQEFVVRRGCVISLLDAPGNCRQVARVTYTGGYVLPGTTPEPGQYALPPDLEQAAVEQVAYWFQNRDKLGLVRQWPHGGTYEVFAQLDLLVNVRAILKGHERWIV